VDDNELLTLTVPPDSGQRAPLPRPPVLHEGQVMRRVRLLTALQGALAAQGLDSVVVRNRRLVLRSNGDRMEPSGPTDPQLAIFAPDGIAMATTDGAAYHFADGQAHPAADPCGAAAMAWRQARTPPQSDAP
jgi:hypothetical protein